MLPINAPHWPYNRPDRPSPAPGSGAHVTANAENPPTRADYASMLEAADSGVGRILQTVARLGLADNTIVIFTNDNGGEWLSNGGPLFNRKWTVWEGGIRVPAIVKWPGRIRAGSVSDQPAITFDWSASILAAAGVMVPATYEGINLFPDSRGSRAEAGADVLLAVGPQLESHAAGGASGRLEARRRREPPACCTTCARTSASATTARRKTGHRPSSSNPGR